MERTSLASDPSHVDVGLLPHHHASNQVRLFVVKGQPEGRSTLVEQVHARGVFQFRHKPFELGVGGSGHFKGRHRG